MSAPTPHTWQKHAKRIVNALYRGIEIYGFYLSLLLIMWLLTGESGWPTKNLVSVLPGALLPPIYAFLPLLLLRRWRTLLTLIVPLAVFIALYGGQFIPKGVSNVPDGARVLSVLTYNLKTEHASYDPLEAIIRRADADIVFLQELSEPAEAQYTANLREQYPYYEGVTFGLSVMGLGIFSKHPIGDVHFGWRDGVWLRYMRAAVEVDGREFVLYNIHTSPPTYGIAFHDAPRHDDIRTVVALATQESAPVLIAGDFNAPDQTEDYRLLAAHFSDTFAEAGYGLGVTWPQFGSFHSLISVLRPFIRLDYIWHSDHFIGLDAAVWPESGGSDHHPVYAELALLPAESELPTASAQP